MGVKALYVVREMLDLQFSLMAKDDSSPATQTWLAVGLLNALHKHLTFGTGIAIDRSVALYLIVINRRRMQSTDHDQQDAGHLSPV